MQALATCLSDTFMSRSCRRKVAPCPIRLSRSISPNRMPPCFFATLHRLTSELVDWPCGSHLTLVFDHVTKSLVVHDTNENLGCHWFAGDPTVQCLAAEVVETRFLELFSDLMYRGLSLVEPEGC